MPDLAPSVRTAERHDYPMLADSLARAFLDDPVTAYLLPDDRTRYRALLPVFRSEMRAAHSRGQILTVDDLTAGALWFTPGRWRTGLLGVLSQAPLVVTSFREHFVRALRLLNTIEKHHPEEPHWYLGVLGTHPDHQGEGLASALIRQVTARCDADGLGAYLESSKLANLAYYERFGFRVTGEVTIPGGPTVWLMWRNPEVPGTRYET